MINCGRKVKLDTHHVILSGAKNLSFVSFALEPLTLNVEPTFLGGLGRNNFIHGDKDRFDIVEAKTFFEAVSYVMLY